MRHTISSTGAAGVGPEPVWGLRRQGWDRVTPAAFFSTALMFTLVIVPRRHEWSPSPTRRRGSSRRRGPHRECRHKTSPSGCGCVSDSPSQGVWEYIPLVEDCVECAGSTSPAQVEKMGRAGHLVRRNPLASLALVLVGLSWSLLWSQDSYWNPLFFTGLWAMPASEHSSATKFLRRPILARITSQTGSACNFRNHKYIWMDLPSPKFSKPANEIR